MNIRNDKHHFSLDWIAVRLLEPLILIYLAVCIPCFSLHALRTFLSLMNRYDLNPVVRPFLRNIGVGLCILEAVFSLRMRKGPGRLLLYGIIAAASISSWQLRAYGTDSNIDSLLWMSVFFILLYSAVYHFGSMNLRRFAAATYAMTLGIWCVACCLSLVQFALQISSYGPNYATSLWLGGGGFYNNRLTGIFQYPEHGAVYGVIVIFIGIYYIIKARLYVVKLLAFLCNLPIFAYIVLSGSRNAMVCLYLASFLGTFLLFWKNLKVTSSRGIFVSLSLAFASVLLLHCMYCGTKKIAEQVPQHFHYSQPTPMLSAKDHIVPNGKIPLASNHSLNKSFRVATLSSPVKSFRSSGTPSVHLALNTMTTMLPSCLPVNSAEETEETPGILDRKYRSGDPSSGRFQIWKDYLSISPSYGLVGLSPKNNSFYIQEHYPDLYICTYIKATIPKQYEKGYVYHTHNGYLHVFVAAGWIGLLCMTLFFARCIVTVVSRIRGSRHLSAEFIITLMVVLVGSTSALFDSEVFFNLNPTSFVFWVALSLLMRLSIPSKKTAHRSSARA